MNSTRRHLQVTFKGVSPLIMHSCQCVNPLHPISMEMKKYTSKRKKTEEDLRLISDLEWEGGLYWKDEVGPVIPAECIEATIQNGAKAFRKGSDIQKYTLVEEPEAALEYGENLTKEELRNDYKYRDTRPVVVQRARIIRTRPRFDRWQFTFTLSYDANKIDLDTIVQAIEQAGSYTGICDGRPKYGRFVAVVEELD